MTDFILHGEIDYDCVYLPDIGRLVRDGYVGDPTKGNKLLKRDAISIRRHGNGARMTIRQPASPSDRIVVDLDLHMPAAGGRGYHCLHGNAIMSGDTLPSRWYVFLQDKGPSRNIVLWRFGPGNDEQVKDLISYPRMQPYSVGDPPPNLGQVQGTQDDEGTGEEPIP